MAKRKLILICQSGGDIVKNEDGSLKYAGGEAQAVNVNCDTLFDDLKLKLAEMCNLEYKTISIKYFLPGNARTLITLANDKDLKRMLDFHKNSVTADVFVIGKQGFDRDALNINTRETGIKIAESVNRDVPPRAAATSWPFDAAGTSAARVASRKTAASKKATPATRVSTQRTATPKKATPTSKKAIPTPKRVTSTQKKATPTPNTASDATDFSDSDNSSDCADSDASSSAPSSPTAFVAVKTAHFSMDVEKTKSLEDSVKKRRRTASWKIGINGPMIVAVSDDDDGDKRSQKRNSHFVNRKGNLDISRRTRFSYRPLEKLIASWKQGITGIGQDFKDVYEFRDALQKYAIANRFVYRLKKNSSTHVSGRCLMEGCSWKIHASRVSSAQSFRIKKFDNAHTCEGQYWESDYQTKNWLVNIIKDRLRDSSHRKPKEIAMGILRDFGIELTYSQVWRGIIDARDGINASFEEAYDQLSGYCEKIKQTNPGSFAKLEIGENKRFQCLFIAFHASINGFQKGCRPLLFLESTSLKSKYQEVLLTATALDGNEGFIPIAFAIVDSENDDKWHWFLEELKCALPNSGSITFVSEREKGLKETVLKVFESAYYGYSIYHLLESFKKSVKGSFPEDGKGSLRSYFLAVAHANRLSGFKKATEQIKQVSSEAYDWVMQIEPEYWTTTSFKGERFNHITINVAQSYILLMEEAWELPITQKIDALISMMRELINTRQMDSSKWSTKLTPSKMVKLQDETIKARGLKIFISSDTLFEVHEDATQTHVVNLNNLDCTCPGWKLTEMPCCHAIAVFNYRRKNVYDYCSKYFTVDSFRLTYSEPINPVSGSSHHGEEEEATSDTEQVLPPCRTSRSPSHVRQNKPKDEDQLQEE